MARSYSNESYGGRQTISIPINVTGAVNSGSVIAGGHKFLYPCTVIGGNITLASDLIGDMSVATDWLVAKSTDAGTGTTTFATCTQLYIDGLATSTLGLGQTFDLESVTATTFTAGDYAFLMITGTPGGVVSHIVLNLEVQEAFEQADS